MIRFPEVHADTGNRARRFLRHNVACAYAAQRASSTGVRQSVQAVMTPRGALWEVVPL